MIKSQIKNDLNSRKEIKIPISKMFSAKAVAIYEKYERTKKYLFDDFTNTEINKALKNIEIKLQSGKKMTFHVARHTCATNLIYHGLPISSVPKILGHDKNETTQLYVKLLDTIGKSITYSTSEYNGQNFKSNDELKSEKVSVNTYFGNSASYVVSNNHKYLYPRSIFYNNIVI